jgi:purine-binding chemotaxis protein CheW
MTISELRDDPTTRHILEERARALAIKETAIAMTPGDELVIFRLGDGAYSLPAQFIRQVHLLGDVTPLPATPAFVVGLVNIRGRLLAALDIRPLLDIPTAPLQPGAFLLALQANGMEIGLVADTVLEVRRSASDLAPSPSTAAGRGISWVRGVDQHLNLLLDPVLLVSDPRLSVNIATN